MDRDCDVSDVRRIVYCGSCGVLCKPDTLIHSRCYDCMYVPITRKDDNKKIELLEENLTIGKTEFKHNGVELRDYASCDDSYAY